MNGTERPGYAVVDYLVFYSSVILNGTERDDATISRILLFYSSVILNGTETLPIMRRILKTQAKLSTPSYWLIHQELAYKCITKYIKRK